MPVTLFKGAAAELGGNFIDFASKSIIVNMTWF